MRICKICRRVIPDNQPFCPFCCPPDATPEDNWSFAPLGDIEYVEDDSDSPREISVEQMEDAPQPELTETQQFNMAFDFNHVTLVGESSSKEPVNYLKAVAEASLPSDEAAQRESLDDIFNPIQKIFNHDEPAVEPPANPARRARSFKISPMKRPGTVTEPAAEEPAEEPVKEPEVTEEMPVINSGKVFAFSPDYTEPAEPEAAEALPDEKEEPSPETPGNRIFLAPVTTPVETETEIPEDDMFFTPVNGQAGDIASEIAFDVTAAVSAASARILKPDLAVSAGNEDKHSDEAEISASDNKADETEAPKERRRLFKAKEKTDKSEKPISDDIKIITKTPGKRLIPADINITPRERGKGAVEKELGELKEQHADAEVSLPLGPAGVTVLILLILVLMTSVGFGIYRLRTAPIKEEQVLLQQLEGAWKSDVFALKGEDDQRLVEVLDIKADGSFSENCYYVDSEGKSTKPAYLINGTVEAFIDENIVLSFCYDTENGQYFFIRELLSITTDGMTLREYYDESHTDSYDLVFTKQS